MRDDDKLTEDPEPLTSPDRCFLVKRNKPLVEKKAKDKQLEEVKALLKTLSTEQIEEIKRKDSNDRVAFLQSERYNDNVRLIHKEEDNAGQSLHLNRAHETNSDSEGWSCIESESDSSIDDEENRAIPPLTDSEESELDEGL